jgi:signal transduction histidine kinase
VLLFAEDLPHIAAPMLGNVILATRQWIELLPRLNPSARNLLRNRRDLGPEVEHALERFGRSDFLIPGPTESTDSTLAPLAAPIDELVAHAQIPEVTPVPLARRPAEPLAAPVELPVQPVAAASASESPFGALTSNSESQIRDLLSRIETFRTRYPQATPQDGADGDSAGHGGRTVPIESFRFETGVDGVISWVQGAPRGPLIGETIAVAARQTDHGVDAHAAGAYRSRTPFRDARLTIAGEGPASGEWRISAVPFFDQQEGRFSGYRGTARRPRADESAAAMTGGVRPRSDPARNDTLRQLAHELRTPLNAIIGFSEMIDGQMRGPASAPYRNRAQEILEQSKKLLSAVEDLDMVAAARAAEPSAAPAPVDAASILARLHANFEAVAAERASGLAFRIDSTLPPVAVDGATVERMLSRLLAATIAMASEGERISVDLQRDPRRSTHMLLTIMRPRALIGRDEKMLLDPGYNPDGKWPDAPVLGLGFALRLVRNLAIASGGMLEIDATRFHLSLPLRGGGRAEKDAI